MLALFFSLNVHSFWPSYLDTPGYVCLLIVVALHFLSLIFKFFLLVVGH